LAADGYGSQRMIRVSGRSHLSPDGGGVTRAACPPLGSGWLREKSQRKKGYFFIRLFAMSPPKPNSVPITIMLGSGTAGGADEDRLATRKPL